MGIKATIVTTCDGCGVTATVELVFPPRIIDGEPEYDQWSMHKDVWQTGWPTGWPQWIDTREQTPDDDSAYEWPKFFHDDACLKAWLIRNGQQAVVDDMENWVAVA